MAGSGAITIDWGDGTVENKTLLDFYYDGVVPYDDPTYRFVFLKIYYLTVTNLYRLLQRKIGRIST